MLSGYSEPEAWNKLALAPLWLKSKFLELIEREKKHAKKGAPAHIIAKVNSLCDLDIIEALYQASMAGVKIDLIVRGICCLKVGIPGISENITVRSIVGNFLEHSRIFYFENGGNAEFYCGSADWMPRNLERRVEILYPIDDDGLKESLIHILDVLLADNMRASIMDKDGTYDKPDRRGKQSVCAHDVFKEEAAANVTVEKNYKDERIFIPRERIMVD